MPDEQLPAWLSAALLDVTPEFRDTDLEEDKPAEVLPGDVCVVRPMNGLRGPGRLFIVTDVTDVEDGWCEGMLAGIETELATEVDALLAASFTGLGYEIAVYTRFFGPVWIAQVSRRVGAVTKNVLHQLLALAWSDQPDGVVVPRGILLQPAGIDPRYPALAKMSAELDQLTDHCRRWRGDLVAPVLDPAIARPNVLRAILSDPRSRSVMAGAVSSSEFRDELLKSLSLSLLELSKDERRALQPLLERALFASPPTSSAGAAHEIADHLWEKALTQVVSRAATHSPTVKVLTHPLCRRGAPQRYGSVLVNFIPVNDTGFSEVA